MSNINTLTEESQNSKPIHKNKKLVKDIDAQVSLFKQLTMVEEEESDARSNPTSMDIKVHSSKISRATVTPRKSNIYRIIKV